MFPGGALMRNLAQFPLVVDFLHLTIFRSHASPVVQTACFRAVHSFDQNTAILFSTLLQLLSFLIPTSDLKPPCQDSSPGPDLCDFSEATERMPRVSMLRIQCRVWALLKRTLTDIGRLLQTQRADIWKLQILQYVRVRLEARSIARPCST
jgi:hypothetical protein